MSEHNQTPSPDAPLPRRSRVSMALEARLTGAEAADALLAMAAEVIRSKGDDETQQRIGAQARRVAGPDAIGHLLELAETRVVGLTTLAVALRFRGAEAVISVLARLHEAEDELARRAYLDLAIALSRFPELRQTLTASLLQDLDSPTWFVVRNAIKLLSDMGADVPTRYDLATHGSREVRLELSKALARRPRDENSVDTLVFLLGDPDAAVRYSAVVALGASNSSRARAALSLHAGIETDGETLMACDTITRHGDFRKSA